MPSQFHNLLAAAGPRIKPPVLIALGAPRLVSEFAASIGQTGTECFQFDLYQAERLRDELGQIGTHADVLTYADLWDVPHRYRTVLFPSPPRGERELKRDLVEQAYHLLEDGGRMVVLSPVENDQFYPALLKKTYGKVTAELLRAGTVLSSPRHGDKPRRRHELDFRVRDGEASLPFNSRPGVFGYGKMDDGARALADVMRIEPGERILDLGCGNGTVGVLAGRRGGPNASVTFVDSNVRAVGLAEQNAKANGLPIVNAIATARFEGLPPHSFDVALANPPYYAQHTIARLFVEASSQLLAPGGRLYLVTKQADIVGEIVAEIFGEPEVVLHRGYAVLEARR